MGAGLRGGAGLGGHLQVRVLCERGDNPAPGPSGSEHSAAEAATSGAAVPPQKDPQSTERGRVPTTGSRPKAAQPRHRPHHDEDHHPAGGSAGGATGRQRLLHFPSRRPGDECDPRLVQISKEWHNRLEAGDPALQSPLRTLLLACLIKHLRELMVLMASSPEAIAKLQAAEWLDQAGEWTYFRWNP